MQLFLKRLVLHLIEQSLLEFLRLLFLGGGSHCLYLSEVRRDLPKLTKSSKLPDRIANTGPQYNVIQDVNDFFQLSGGAAIRAMNVCLHLVDQHTHPTSHGAVQLFNVPHPRRLIPSPYLSPSPPTIIRKQPRVDGSVAGRTADIEVFWN